MRPSQLAGLLELLAFGIAFAGCAGGTASTAPVTLAIINARVWTADDARPRVTGGRVVFDRYRSGIQ